ncbi:uncharacterized protein LOC110989258 isoform X2 [Acanthaster planci]|nr:uncharacterized protein LOC110989258 isoform X2 [Acanthaster planci]XP_022109225.1 uncharacterized protein LOC110989258 isoform X2 [Acanthaster planci]XP_022109232.1 uncharacterized protein LOC110989258 isoform X2 [Acanthaster planci]
MTFCREPDTGTFLQQFTNSVSRALHKQICTCNGRAYTADELRLKSNPAIFAPNYLETFRRSNDGFPPTTWNGAVSGHKSTRVGGSRGYSQMQTINKPGYDFEPQRRRENLSRKAKKLGEAFPRKRPRKEVNLPERLDVVDKSGQNWQIVQELPKLDKKRLGRLRPIVASHVIPESLTLPNSSRLGVHQTGVLSKSAPEAIALNHFPNDCAMESQAGHASIEFDPPKTVPHQAPTRKFLELSESSHVCMPCQLKNKSTSMPDIGKGSLERMDYGEVSQPASLITHCDNENEEIASHGLKSQTSEEAGTVRLPRLNTENKFNHSRRCKIRPNFQVDLEDLYSRGGLKISTLRIDAEGTLPGNFLNRDRDELRQMYPMYDWRIAHETREANRHGKATTSSRTKETLPTTSTFQFPATFSNTPKNSPRERPRFTGKEWKRHRKAVTGEKSRASELLETVKEETGGAGGSATVVEQVGMAQHIEETRPSSGLFPRQPPPTPMDSRRKRAVETQPSAGRN